MAESKYQLLPRSGKPRHHSPSRLRGWFSTNILGLIVDIILVLCQIAFITYGIFVLRMNGESAEPGTKGASLIQASRIGPTIFPMIFAATVARCCKVTGSWMLQRQGASIGLLSQLIGSQSISSAFIAQFKLKTLSIIGILTMLLWLTSPLGSQATGRVIYSAVETVYTTKPLQYMDTFYGYTYDLIAQLTLMSVSVGFPSASSLIASHLLASRNQDVWGNIRMPSIERLESMGNESVNGWHTIEETDSLTYASMVGTPVYGISSIGNTTSVISGSYVAMKCDDIRSLKNYSTYYDNQFLNMEKPTNGDDCCWNEFDLQMRAKLWVSGSSSGIASVDFGSNKTRSQRQLYWQSISGNGVLSYTKCNIFTTYVDTNITCQESPNNSTSGSVCQATRARRTPSENHINSNWTAIDLTYQSSLSAGAFDVMQFLFRTLNLDVEFTADSGGSELNNPFVLWMTYPDTAFASYMNTSSLAGDISNVTAETFEIRLSQILNSFLTVGINPTAFSGSAYTVGTNADPRPYLDATGTIGVNGVYVRYDRTWLIILFASAGIALFCALLTIILRALTNIPDILDTLGLMFVRSTIPAVSGSSTWDASEWVEKNKDVVLVVRDITADSDVGHIGIASLPPKRAESLGWIQRKSERMYE